MAVTKPAGAWTYEDLFSLPDDAFHTVQSASGDDDAISPLLGDIAFPVPAVFRGIDEWAG